MPDNDNVLFLADGQIIDEMPNPTTDAVLDRMNAAANKILRDPEVKKNLEGEGMAIVGGNAEQFNKRIRNDHARWVKLVRDARLKGE